MGQRSECIAVLCGAGIIMLSACAHTPSAVASNDDVPESLRVNAGNSLVLQAHAVGAQIYRCAAANDDAANFVWTLSAPDAVLSNKAGKQIAKHYSGPTWEAIDGSKVIGEAVASSVSPRQGSIPWLLLRAKSTSGSGLLSRIAYIQRVHTMGGNAPPSCNASQNGEQLRVSYTADYYFYGPAAGS